MIIFDKLPSKNPSTGSSIEPGRYLAQVSKAEIKQSTNSKEDYLKVTFITQDKKFVSENYFDRDNDFLRWKLGRLVNATNITLEGAGTLKDLTKLLVGRKVTIDVTVNDKGYANLDYSNGKEGIYQRDQVVTAEVEKEEPTLAADLSNAIASTDEEF